MSFRPLAASQHQRNELSALGRQPELIFWPLATQPVVWLWR